MGVNLAGSSAPGVIGLRLQATAGNDGEQPFDVPLRADVADGRAGQNERPAPPEALYRSSRH